MPKQQFTFVDRPHLENLFALLMLSGAVCAKCGFGTRKTSKNWRRCKRCGERVRSREVATILRVKK